MKSSDFKKQFTSGNQVTYVARGEVPQTGYFLTYDRVTKEVTGRLPDGTFATLDDALDAHHAKRLMLEWIKETE